MTSYEPFSGQSVRQGGNFCGRSGAPQCRNNVTDRSILKVDFVEIFFKKFLSHAFLADLKFSFFGCRHAGFVLISQN
jgi:hypothetical protein